MVIAKEGRERIERIVVVTRISNWPDQHLT
jgi:hypothetical protein